MKIGRKKQIKRIMKYYKINYGFEEPYRLLIDGTFIMAALKNKIHIKEQFPKILGGKTTPIVTDCIFKEIEMLNRLDESGRADFSGAKLVARGYFRHKCGHIYSNDKKIDGAKDGSIERSFHFSSDNETGEADQAPGESQQSLSGNEEQKLRTFDSFRCILDIVSRSNNSKKFIVASQDTLLRKKLHKVPGVPLVYLNNQVPILEHPSAASSSQKLALEESRLGAQEWEYSLIPSLSNKTFGRPESLAEKRTKKKKKNPNPLSCLKKKQKKPLKSPADPPEAGKKKRVRTKRRINTPELP
ncbi:rRNA-processing protein UTP23 [Cryptosporidium felis]|nr:rRNA-processing protein UTP23 [Cryptosporidium felis]